MELFVWGINNICVQTSFTPAELTHQYLRLQISKIVDLVEILDAEE